MLKQLYHARRNPLPSLLYIAFDERNGHEEWDLPQELRPLDPAVSLSNADLVGWAKAEKLTPEQRAGIRDDLIYSNNANCRYIGFLPINRELMQYVGSLFENSKYRATNGLPTSTRGSPTTQIPFTLRSDADLELGPYLKAVGKLCSTPCYS